MIRITIAAPIGMVSIANQLAQCVGYDKADGETFGAETHKDADGALYVVASGPVQPAFVQDALADLSEPPWGCDLEAARAAQAVVSLWKEDTPVLASPDIIAAYIGDDDKSAVDALGLVPLG